MLVGIIGKPSSGKTTILNALCLTDAKVGIYPFTTIDPNRGVAYLYVKCPCHDKDFSCNPRSGSCDDGVRSIPVEMLDVAGLVPGASKGKGMGNRFLDDLRQADVLIHVVDTTGKFDAEGNPTTNYDPSTDIEWLDEELSQWIHNILFKDWDPLSIKLDADRSKTAGVIAEKLSGLKVSLNQISTSLRLTNLGEKNPKHWTDPDKESLAKHIRQIAFPTVIAANKLDSPDSAKNTEIVREKYPNITLVSTSWLAELTLRKANENKAIKYIPGNTTIEILDENHKIIKTVTAIKERLFDSGISTGVGELLSKTIFDVIEFIVVYPVEDSSKLTDKDGRVLPDVFLVPKNIPAREFAGKIHSDFEKSFIHAILVSDSNKRISATHELKNHDIIKIVSATK